VAAILIEPIQGEGGIQIPSEDYLARVREICDREEWLMILDEVQSGNGRTGKYFAYQHSAILPDIVTTAKGLGNGFPIGVCLARGAAAELFKPGNHGSTFGGSPLACAVALAVIETIEKEGLVERAAATGERMLRAFTERLAGSNRVKQVRGKGLMIGIELAEPGPELVRRALEKGLLMNVTVEKVVRLLPPLVITDGQADEIVDTVCTLIEEL
jgi:acetylornithine aminotransferase